jgi:hypothetical protein
VCIVAVTTEGWNYFLWLKESMRRTEMSQLPSYIFLRKNEKSGV